MNLTRREWIKLLGATLIGAALPPLPPYSQRARVQARVGRITAVGVTAHAEPDASTPVVRRYRYNDIVTYFEEIEAEGPNPHNPIWFRVIGGYIYSSFVQPVEIFLNTPIQHIPESGLWGEVSVPYTYLRIAPSPQAPHSYRLYYSSTYHIAEAVWGEDHHLWYRLRTAPRHFVPAAHIRPILPEDLTPISPHVRDKRIEISLADQLLTAFEGKRVVLQSHISGGTGGNRATPIGEYRIIFKSPSRHMVGEGYDLPGVPFASYFWGAVAIHGTYWHNDYGRPRSHGCVNVPSDVARWIYRWTRPTVPYDEEGLRVEDGGTPVLVSTERL